MSMGTLLTDSVIEIDRSMERERRNGKRQPAFGVADHIRHKRQTKQATKQRRELRRNMRNQ